MQLLQEILRVDIMILTVIPIKKQVNQMSNHLIQIQQVFLF